jgi:hypothetical protein
MRRTGLGFHEALAALERREPGRYARKLHKAEAAAAPAKPETGCPPRAKSLGNSPG